mgnify:CR=1 FL=1
MSTRARKNYKKILSSCIVLSMILTGFATFLSLGPVETVKAQDPVETTPPSLRIYGEENAIYPTHSFKGQDNTYSNDFIYPDETTPFDPGVIEKDSITFNPAWIGHEYGMTSDIGEKVFLRAFYEPEYTHGIDSKMSDWYNDSIYQNTLEEVNHPYGPFDAVVLETTYMTTKPLLSGRDPIMVNEGNRIWLPYASNDPQVPGMDTAGLVYLNEILYGNSGNPARDPDYPLDQSAIAIEQEYFLHLDPQSGETDTATFLDHQITYSAWEDVPHPDEDQIDIRIRYTGNPTNSPQLEAIENEKMQTWKISEQEIEDNFFFFDRENKMFTNTPNFGEPGARWYARIMYANEDYMRVRLGRYLVEGETFYVDGLRYDIPSIYVELVNDYDCMFKYITLQTPYPKCETMWHEDDYELNVHDWSHVPSQYLYNLPSNQNLWLLPPFSDDYKMIDDIGLDRDEVDEDRCVPAAGILLDGPLNGKYEALDFYYVDEYYEERFNSTLAERLNTEGDSEFWEWYNVYTKPNRYTEFILPDAEKTNQEYYSMDPHSTDYSYADGNEYFVTTSFYGPNSEVDTDRDGCCKTYDEHEIYDRSHELTNVRTDMEQPRVAFEFDAMESKDLYVNEYNDDATVRIYGEDTSDGAFYPTHSWSGSQDDFYKDETDPFDPGVIEKDSITFNPAFLGHEYGMTGDVSEKVFLRTFYEPGYHHLSDDLMSDWYDEDYTPINNLHEVNHPYGPFDAVVQETTYMMTKGILEDRHPVTVGTGSRIWLPYTSMDNTHYGMDYGGLVWLHEIYHGETVPLDEDTDGENYLTDGAIAVEQEFILKLDPEEGETDTAKFMDHEIQFVGYENTPQPDFDNVDIKVKYLGNPSDIDYLEEIKSQIWEIREKDKNYYFDRANNKYCSDQPGSRWYIRIEYSNDDYMRVRLGRYLYAGETFYVDGVRYDIPSVYVTDDNKFKYITFQTPYPKCDTIWYQNLNLNVHDWSHVPTQYLVNLPEDQPIWVLPPFQDDHQLIDDVGLIKDKSGQGQWCIPAAGLLLDGPIENVYGAGLYGPLQYYYTEEYYEERFSTSLAERLITEESDEYWQWYNAFTKPYHYTEFYLPDQETTTDPYYYLDPWNEGYDYGMADGNEYLITSSWYAPNCEPSAMYLDQCREYDAHDIRDMMTDAPRMAFEHDGTDGIGLYINHQSSGSDPEPEDPVLSYSPGSHNFGRVCIEDEGPDSTTFEIWNSGEGTLEYTLSETCGWVTSVTPISGTSDGEYDSIVVNIDTTGLSEGSYSCDIAISSNGGSGTFTVSVQIGCTMTDTTIQITDAHISQCNYGYSDLIFDNVEDLGAVQLNLDYDEDKVQVTSILYSSEIDLIVTDLPDEGKINIVWFAMTPSSAKTFDTPTTVLTIEFEALVSPEDQAPLTLGGSIYDIDSLNIMYTPIDGVTYIDDCESDLVEADFDGSGEKNILDALYIAQQLTLPFADQEFNGCHPNVNCDVDPTHPLDANILDALYLAKHLTGAPGYDLYKYGCPQWL